MSSLEDRLKQLEPAPASDALRARLAHPGRTRSRAVRYIPLAAAAAALIAVFIFAVTEAPHGKTTSTTEAESEFRKIEETLAAAGTLRVAIRRTAFIPAVPPKMSQVDVLTIVQLKLKAGNRMQARLQEKAASAPAFVAEHLFCSDGKRMKTMVVVGSRMKNVVSETDAPGDLHQRFILALARKSVAVPGNLMALPFEEQKLDSVASDLRPGTPQNGLPALTYRIGLYEATLFYDPRTHLPVERWLKNDKLGSFVESYQCEVDVPMDDGEFALPPEKE